MSTKFSNNRKECIPLHKPILSIWLQAFCLFPLENHPFGPWPITMLGHKPLEHLSLTGPNNPSILVSRAQTLAMPMDSLGSRKPNGQPIHFLRNRGRRTVGKAWKPKQWLFLQQRLGSNRSKKPQNAVEYLGNSYKNGHHSEGERTQRYQKNYIVWPQNHLKAIKNHLKAIKNHLKPSKTI